MLLKTCELLAIPWNLNFCYLGRTHISFATFPFVKFFQLCTDIQLESWLSSYPDEETIMNKYGPQILQILGHSSFTSDLF